MGPTALYIFYVHFRLKKKQPEARIQGEVLLALLMQALTSPCVDHPETEEPPTMQIMQCHDAFSIKRRMPCI